jgi:hypothetical protein
MLKDSLSGRKRRVRTSAENDKIRSSTEEADFYRDVDSTPTSSRISPEVKVRRPSREPVVKPISTFTHLGLDRKIAVPSNVATNRVLLLAALFPFAILHDTHHVPYCLFRSHEFEDQRCAEIATAGAALEGVCSPHSSRHNARIARCCSNAYDENNE